MDKKAFKKIEKRIYYDKDIGYTNIEYTDIECLSVKIDDSLLDKNKELIKRNSMLIEDKDSFLYKAIVGFEIHKFRSKYISIILIGILIMVCWLVFSGLSGFPAYGAVALVGVIVLIIFFYFLLGEQSLYRQPSVYIARCSVHSNSVVVGDLSISILENIEEGTECLLVYSENDEKNLWNLRLFITTNWFN